MLPFISIIIPARNEEAYIENTIRMLLSQDYPAHLFEIIVVDGISTDSTVEKVKKLANQSSQIKLFPNPKKLSSSARNIGAQNAKGEIITYIDAHVYISNNSLIKHTAQLIKKQKLNVLSRPQFLDTPGISNFQNAVALARKAHIGHGLDSTIYLTKDQFVEPYSSGATYTRKVFETIGYFDEKFDAAEDVEFNYRCGRAGFQSFTSMKLAVYYFPRKTLFGLFTQMKRYGIGRMRLFKKHKAGVSSGPFLLSFFLFIYLSFIISSLIYSPLRIISIILFLGYFIFCIIDCFLIDKKRTIDHFFRLLPIFICIHTGLIFGLLVEAFNFKVVFNNKK